MGIFPDRKMGQKMHLAADPRKPVGGRERDEDFVADSVDVHDHLGGQDVDQTAV
jgi:hypothetical protein